MNSAVTSTRLAVDNLRRALRLYGGNGTARAWSQLFSYIVRRPGRVSPPKIVTLAVTDRCPCACPHCYAGAIGSGGIDPMSREEWTGVIDQVKGIGTLEVIFTGGEPLLRDDLPDLVACAHKKGLLTRLSTNAYLLDRERVIELKRAGLDQCGISMDDADPAVHDSLRGLPGLHERATRALRLLREQGIRTRILAYASHRNVPEGLKRIIGLGRALGVDSVYINIPFAAGRWTGSFDEVLSEAEMAEIRAILEPGFAYFEFPTPETRCCSFRKGILLITANGEVTPCPVIPYPVGRLREAPLAEIWRRHVLAMRRSFRGTCPMNDERGREALRAHAEAVAGTSGTKI